MGYSLTIKKMLPEFDKGWGSSLVHEESSMINYELLNETLKSGNNIVLPIVGSKVSSVEAYIDLAKKYGYHVNLHLNELSNTKAIGRLLKRYFETGRFIDPTYVAEYGDKPIEVYEELKKRSIIDGYSRWNNDVPRGQRPRSKDGSVSNRAFIEYSASYGKIGRRDVEKNDSRGRNEEERAEQIKYSRKKPSDTITMSRGEAAKRNANYESNVVFDKKDIVAGLNSVEAFGKLPADLKESYTEEVWRLFNTFIDPSRRKMYIDMVSKRLYIDVIKNGDFAIKETRSIPSVIAQHARLGNIADASLDNSLSRFKKKVNGFT